MSNKKERLREVYAFLRRNKGIYYQKDFADAIGAQRPGLSAAMNGNEAYLTDNLFKKICYAYPGVFNIDYLLTGEGSLLMNAEPTQTSKEKESAAVLIELAAKLIKEVEAIRHELSDELAEIRAIRHQMQVNDYPAEPNPSSIMHVANRCKQCK